MTDLDLTGRIDEASRFVLQSPPGEINDVLNDIRVMIGDDGALEEGIRPALREYNLAQFTLISVPDAEHQTIVSQVAQIPDSDEERFLDPRSKISFRFDHLTLEASDPRPEEHDPETEPHRAALESAAQSYLGSHYFDGISATFPPRDSPSCYIVQIVSNKYNPDNFWSGRWRSEYQIDLAENMISGKVLVNVHYYEQGNVQLETSHKLSIPIPPAVAKASPKEAANKIFALIEKEETQLQISLNGSYEMSERAFKGLRRALPLTRQKIDWDKVSGYKLGAELTASKGAFASAS